MVIEPCSGFSSPKKEGNNKNLAKLLISLRAEKMLLHFVNYCSFRLYKYFTFISYDIFSRKILIKQPCREVSFSKSSLSHMYLHVLWSSRVLFTPCNKVATNQLRSYVVKIFWKLHFLKIYSHSLITC